MKLYQSNLIKEKILFGIDALTCVQVSVPVAGDGFDCNVADDVFPELCQLRGMVGFIFPFAVDRTAAVSAAGKMLRFIWRGAFTISLIAYDELI